MPGDPDQPTGGYRYDARVAAELRDHGREVEVVGLAGRFPDADIEASAALDSTLRALPDGQLVVIDGLALGGLPEIAHRHAERLDLVALVHHPLADETGLSPTLQERLLESETRALDACRRIVTTSAFTARRLAALGARRGRIRVVPPGVDPAEAREAGDSQHQRLLCVGSLVPRKGQDLLVEALSGLLDYSWRLELVGDPDRDRPFSESLRNSIRTQGLEQRIAIHGVQDQRALDAIYRSADLMVVPSRYEGYGMVVTEALARALPLIATTGGALVDTVPPEAALQVPPGDRDALAGALRRWLDDPGLRAAKRDGAARVRRALGDWTETGRRFADALDFDNPLPGPGDGVLNPSRPKHDR